MVGFRLIGDLFSLFVFFELVSVTAYALTAYKIEEAGPLQGAINFAVVNTIGASLLLTGVALLYKAHRCAPSGADWPALAQAPVDGLVIVAFMSVIAGFCIKAALECFYFAHADAHAVETVPVLTQF